jgi:hypothetical protein
MSLLRTSITARSPLGKLHPVASPNAEPFAVSLTSIDSLLKSERPIYDTQPAFSRVSLRQKVRSVYAIIGENFSPNCAAVLKKNGARVR